MIRNKNQLQEPKKGTETPFFNDIFESQVTGKDYLLFGMHSHSFSESSIEKNNAEVVNQSFHFSPHDTNERKNESRPYFEKKQGALCSAVMNHRIETKKQSIKKILYSFIDNIGKYQLDDQFRKQLKEKLQIDKVKNNRDCLKDLDLNVKRTECKSQNRKKSSPYKWVKIKIDRRSCQKKIERSYTYRNSNKPANSPRFPSTTRYYMNKG